MYWARPTVDTLPKTETMRRMLKHFSTKVIFVNASDIVKRETGNIVSTNIYMLGYALSKKLIPLKKSSLLKGIEEITPKKYLEVNKRIFELGLRA